MGILQNEDTVQSASGLTRVVTVEMLDESQKVFVKAVEDFRHEGKALAGHTHGAGYTFAKETMDLASAMLQLNRTRFSNQEDGRLAVRGAELAKRQVIGAEQAIKLTESNNLIARRQFWTNVVLAVLVGGKLIVGALDLILGK